MHGSLVGITQRVVQGYGVNPERGCKSGRKKTGTTDPWTEASFHTARISAGPATSAGEALNILLNPTQARVDEVTPASGSHLDNGFNLEKKI